MSDGGKIESEIINYSVSRGNKYNQMENETTALMENESRISNSSKNGSGGNFSPRINCLTTASSRKFYLVENYSKLVPFTKSNVKSVIIKFLNLLLKFIISAENSKT